ncbi:hypothetical protein MHIMP23_18600 [Methylobacterium hispanicum]
MEEALREAGILKEGDLYDAHNVSLVHHVNQALRANTLFTRDKDYIGSRRRRGRPWRRRRSPSSPPPRRSPGGRGRGSPPCRRAGGRPAPRSGRSRRGNAARREDQENCRIGA